MKKRGRGFCPYICVLAVLWLFLGRASLLSVYAAEGKVLFGSNDYIWEKGEICPIGIYIKGAIPVASYSVCLEYDASMLAYLEGADRTEGNRIYLEGGGTDKNYKRMLLFEPLQEGTTALRVVSAAGICLLETADSDAQAEEAWTVDWLRQVPVTIEKKSSSLLRLEIPEAVGMEPFAPELFEYHFQVKPEVEELEITYEAENEAAIVELAGTQLAEGENTVTVTVRETGAEAAVYTLYVERGQETAPVLEAAKEPPEKEGGETGTSVKEAPEKGRGETGTSAEEPSEKGIQEAEVTKGVQDSEPALLAAVLFVCILAALYAVFRIIVIRKTRKAGLSTEEEVWKDTKLNIINMEKTVIDIRHVTMNFRLAQEEASSLKEYFIRMLKGQNHYATLTALKDISFEVKQGDVLGIIGTNGSGKSTLLKIIAGALIPTKGEVIADKSRVQMLTLGTGFDMELTARENVYLNGAIIGYTKEYIDERYEDIVEFAELQGFMDERMKNFSTGMVSRLAFAIATMRDAPDILILDEVLSVGDMFFKQKSEKRIKQMIHSGATVLIVSHSADVICKNCDRAVWIEKGELKMLGNPKEVCAAYEKYGRKTA